jgi:hypothetical protein
MQGCSDPEAKKHSESAFKCMFKARTRPAVTVLAAMQTCSTWVTCPALQLLGSAALAVGPGAQHAQHTQHLGTLLATFGSLAQLVGHEAKLAQVRFVPAQHALHTCGLHAHSYPAW